MEPAWLSLYSMISCIFLMMVWSAGNQPTVSRLLLVSHFAASASLRTMVPSLTLARKVSMLRWKFG